MLHALGSLSTEILSKIFLAPWALKAVNVWHYCATVRDGDGQRALLGALDADSDCLSECKTPSERTVGQTDKHTTTKNYSCNWPN